MSMDSKGPVQTAIETRLTEALQPGQLTVTNDSGQHRGHAGDDGSGESHFSVAIESAAFTGKTRVERQRMVNRALGDLMQSRVHAMRIKARAPGE